MSRIPALEATLHDAAARLDTSLAKREVRSRFGRLPVRSAVLAAVLLVFLAGSAAAGTLLVLRGSVIPGPALRDVPSEQTPVPDSAKVAPERARDPGAGPDWALRTARSRAGFICSTVGQVDGGEFGLVGLDGRFRKFAVRIVDGCGLVRDNAASLIGARVFDARRATDVRTVVNGIGGPELRRVTVEAAGRSRSVAVGNGGVFVAAFRGYPEDLGIQVALRFEDGHVERHPFGASPYVVPDPAGGHAWKLQNVQNAAAPPPGCHGRELRTEACRPDPDAPREICAIVRPARDGPARYTASATVCGRLATQRGGKLRRLGYFFGVRRETPSRRRIPTTPFGGVWHGPPRTFVFGSVGDDVRRIEVSGPEGVVPARIQPGGGFLVMFGPNAKTNRLTVRVVMKGGRVETRRGDTNLVKPRML